MLFDSLDTNKSVLLLDIDGVLNPFSLSRPPTWPDFEQATIGYYDLWYSRQMAARLARLDVQLAWSSTWCDDPQGIHRYAELLGIDPWWGGRWGESFGWKDDLAIMAAQTFPAVIWVDDDEPVLNHYFNLYRFSPIPVYGLTPQDIDRIEALTHWLKVECPVCGLPGEHDACEDALQVEPYESLACVYCRDTEEP